MSESARRDASGADRTRRPAPRANRDTKTEPGPFGRLTRFVRQVIAELKKVVRPSRADLIGYATAVLVFVAVVMAFVTVIDFGAGSLMNWVFAG